MKKILITGAAGFIGRQLSNYLENKGVPTIDIDDLSVTPRISPKKKLINIKVQNIDSSFLNKHSIETIIHLAAKKSVDESFYNLSNSVENYEMTLKLLSETLKSDVKRFYNASTCEIFGYQKKKLKEISIFSPHSPYAVTKVANELLCNLFMMQKRNLKITSLIFFNTYGPSEGIDAVIPKFINTIINGGKIKVEGNGCQRRDFTFIDDTIEAIFKIITSKKYFRSINIGSGKDISINQLIKILKQYFPKMKLIYVPGRVNEIKTFVANTVILNKFYNFIPKYNINLGLKKTINSFIKCN